MCNQFVSYWRSHTRRTIADEREKDKTNPELDGFHASNGWLDSFKTTYGIRETTTVISGEAGDVPITTVKA